MPQEALREKREIEEDSGHAGPGDEERFEGLGAYVGYVCDTLVWVHGWVVWLPTNVPVDEEAHEHAEPAEGGDDREDPV